MSGNLAPTDSLSWPKSNYINPERRSWMPMYVGVLQGLSSVVAILRFWLRARKQAGTLGLDDTLSPKHAFILPAWLASIAFSTFTLLSTERYRSGTHIWDVPPRFFEPLAMAGWSSEMTFIISTGLTKCSVLFFYRRLTKGSYDRKWKYAIIFAIAVTVCWTVAFVVLLTLACSPTESYWKSKNPSYNGEYTCRDWRSANIISGVMSVVTDLYSVLLPCLMLWDFQAPRRQKIALNTIFCLGMLVVAAGSVRTYYLHQLGYTLDLTYTGFDVFVWAQLEAQLAIICASAPALRVFFRKYLSDPMVKVLSSIRSHSNLHSQKTSKGSANCSASRDVSPIPLTQMSDSNRERHLHTTKSEEEASVMDSNASSDHMNTATFDWDRHFEGLEDSRPESTYWRGRGLIRE